MRTKDAKKIAWVLLLGFALLMTCSIAGCSAPPQQPPGGAGQTQGGPIGAQQTTTAVTTRPAPGSVNAVDFNTLIPLLPTVPAGWTADDPTGMTNQYQGGSWSMAMREYTNVANDNIRATVTIMDSAYYDVGAWGAWGTYQEIQSTEGYWKSGTVGGYPSWETYDKKGNSYGTWIGINQRFMIIVTLDGGSKGDLDTFVHAVNYQGIANLK